MSEAPEKDIISIQDAHKTLAENSGLANKIIQGEGALQLHVQVFAQITNCEFECEVMIHSVEEVNLQVDNSRFQALIISNSSIDIAYFQECYIRILYLTSIKVKGKFRFENCEFEDINLSDNKEQINEIEFEKRPTQENSDPKSSVKFFQIYDGCHIVKSKGLDVYFLNFSNRIEQKSEIYFEDGEVNQIQFSEVSNLGTVILNRMLSDNKGTSGFSVYNSDLGDLQLQNMNLNAFESFKVDTSNFLNISSFNVVWPNRISSTDVLHKIETYRQFKQVAIREGNRKNELKFLAKEKVCILFYEPLIWRTGLMEKCRSMATWIGSRKISAVTGYFLWTFSFAWKSIRQLLAGLAEKFMLTAGFITNNFGNYWLLPLIWLFVMNNIAYNLVCDQSSLGYEADFKNFWLILNPTHSTKYLDDILLSTDQKAFVHNAAYSVDYLSRAVNAFLYVQIVTGFRKFSKK